MHRLWESHNWQQAQAEEVVAALFDAPKFLLARKYKRAIALLKQTTPQNITLMDNYTNSYNSMIALYKGVKDCKSVDDFQMIAGKLKRLAAEASKMAEWVEGDIESFVESKQLPSPPPISLHHMHISKGIAYLFVWWKDRKVYLYCPLHGQKQSTRYVKEISAYLLKN